ncbi:MAG TPA: NYN domain-containing protein [Gemmataceae bacterium]|nr:NYN domain-containing protein [Gemmataceae bacterium]
MTTVPLVLFPLLAPGLQFQRRPTSPRRCVVTTFLIDGYNLLHAIGLASRAMSAKGLERARTRLLDWLADAATGRAEWLRVVFDARLAPRPSGEHDHRGVRVSFAHGQTADDRIEELLAAEPRPETLAVVSNDSRVQEDARRRGARVFTCQEFVDWLIDKRPDSKAPDPSPDKPAADATPDEMAAWLAAFSRPKKPK